VFIVEGKYNIFGSEGTKEEEMRTEEELFEGRSIFRRIVDEVHWILKTAVSIILHNHWGCSSSRCNRCSIVTKDRIVQWSFKKRRKKDSDSGCFPQIILMYSREKGRGFRGLRS
jgi:hypothetical protein